MEGIKALANFITEKVKDLEVIDAVIFSDCVAGKLCAPEDYFEMITMCKLCGKLL